MCLRSALLTEKQTSDLFNILAGEAFLACLAECLFI